MFEELKKKLDGLAQEVALLKEQQALQTGECSTAAGRNTLTRGQAAVREKAQFPVSATLESSSHMPP